MNNIEILGIAAGILTSLSQLPQLIKILKIKEAESLSLGMMITLMVGLGLWTYYGFLRKDLPIIITNIFSETLNLLLLFLVLSIRKKKHSHCWLCFFFLILKIESTV